MKTFLTVIMSILLISCTERSNNDPANPSLGSTSFLAEFGVNAVSSAIDEQTGENLLASNKPSFIDLIIQKAYAASCSRAVVQNCSNAKRTLEYNGCQINNRVYQGIVELSYSRLDCSLVDANDTVTRNVSTYIYGAHNGTIVNSSNPFADYRRISYGGGVRLTRLPESVYQLDVLGKHAQVIINTYLAADVSVRTIAPISVTSGLSRTNRTLNGGQMEISHNVFQYTGTMSFNNLRYSSSCCYPVSGSLSVTYSGRREGTSTVTFSGCGVGSVVEDGSTTAFQMNYCE